MSRNVSLLLDKKFAEYIKLRDNFICFTCGRTLQEKTYECQAGHLFSRSFINLRWDERNCHCQCVRCNNKHEYEPSIYIDAYINRYGEDKYNELYYERNKLLLLRHDQMEEMLNKYISKINDINLSYNLI